MGIRVRFVDNPSGRACCKICNRVIRKEENALCFIGNMLKFYIHFMSRQCEEAATLIEAYDEIKGWDR
jgi:hypothetical protein